MFSFSRNKVSSLFLYLQENNSQVREEQGRVEAEGEGGMDEGREREKLKVSWGEGIIKFLPDARRRGGRKKEGWRRKEKVGWMKGGRERN